MQPEELEECIDLEIVKTEKRRLEIFILVLIFGLLLLLINIVFFPISLSGVFMDARSIYGGVYIALGFIILLLISRTMVGRIASCDKPLPRAYKFYSIFIESLIPAIWLCFMIELEENAAFLDSPLVFIYVPILIVSALHLSFWLSFFNGFLVALMYGAVSFWAISNYPDELFLPSIAYYSKAALFLMAGVCGGFVARELKKRLTMTIETQEEKDQIEALFSQQVSKQVVEALKSKRDFSVKTEITVFFLDIRNFTRRVQYMEPEEVNKFQNRFFGPVFDCIINNGGVINQLMGDGLMATFGEREGEDHHQRALRAAEETLGSIGFSNADLEDPIEVGIGMHSGEVIAGNIGTEKRQQFSISGIPVITAARLEQLTKKFNCSLLVSREFYEKIKHLTSDSSSLGKVKLKGIDVKTEIIKIR